jgi:hypothetical protein
MAKKKRTLSLFAAPTCVLDVGGQWLLGAGGVDASLHVFVPECKETQDETDIQARRGEENAIIGDRQEGSREMLETSGGGGWGGGAV